MLFEKRKKRASLGGGPKSTTHDDTALFKFQGRQMVFGLSWRALRHSDASMRREEAKESARVAGANFGALIESSSGRSMIGFLPTATEVNAKKAISGAGFLACSVDKRTWLVVPLPDGRWWLAKVRPSEIESKGDLVGTSEDIGKEIDNAYADAQREGGDEPPRILIADTLLPDSQVLAGNDQAYEVINLKTLLTDSAVARRARFTRILGVPPEYILGAAVVVGLCALLAGGWYVHQNHQEQLALEAAQRDAALRAQQQAQISTLREARMLRAVADALAADTKTPVPSSISQRAARDVLVFNPEAAGWLMKSATVSASSIQSDWTYPRGSIGDNATFLSYAESIGGIGSVTPDNRGASIMVPVASIPSRESLTLLDLPTEYVASYHLGTWLQRLAVSYPDVKVAIDAPTPKSITYIDGSKPTPVPDNRTYKVGKFSANGTSLASLASFTPDFHYVTVSSVSLQIQGTSNDYQWHADGTYVVSP